MPHGWVFNNIVLDGAIFAFAPNILEDHFTLRHKLVFFGPFLTQLEDVQ